LAVVYIKSGQIQKANKAYEEVLEMSRRDPETPAHMISLASSLLNMGWCLLKNAEAERALPILERSLMIMRENLPENHLHLAHCKIICNGIYE
jgi:Tfp pilus assembly protein PilF